MPRNTWDEEVSRILIGGGTRNFGVCGDPQVQMYDGVNMQTQSFVAEGFYGVHFCGLHGGDPAADYTDDDENECR